MTSHRYAILEGEGLKGAYVAFDLEIPKGGGSIKWCLCKPGFCGCSSCRGQFLIKLLYCKSNKGEGYSPVAVHTVRAIRGRGAVLWLFTL